MDMTKRLWIYPIILWVSAFTFCLPAVQANEPAPAANQNRHYPPYPDVWQWQVDHPEAIESGSFQTALLDNGDVLVLYAEQVRDKRTIKNAPIVTPGSIDQKIFDLTSKARGRGVAPSHLVLRQFTLFGRQTVRNAPSTVRILRGQVPEIELSDGSIVHIVKKADWRSDLADGTTVSSGYLSRTDCFRGPENASFSRRDKDYKPIWNKVLFMLLDRPVIFQAGMSGLCPEGEYPRLVKRVEALWGRVLGLPDGTFLFEGNDLIIRFDRNFESRSPLMNRKLFAFNAGFDLVPAIAKPKGRDYGPDSPGGPYLYQQALDDLYQYLTALKRKAP